MSEVTSEDNGKTLNEIKQERLILAKQKYNFEEFCNLVVKLETKMIDYPRFEETYEKHLWDVCDTAVEISNKFYKKNVAKLSDCERILKFNELLNIFIKTFVPFYEL